MTSNLADLLAELDNDPPAPPSLGRTASQRRRVSRMTYRLELWAARRPAPERRPFYPFADLAAAVGASARDHTALARALRAAGWLRQQVRLTGKPEVIWVAPGCPSPLRARGRPRTRRTT